MIWFKNFLLTGLIVFFAGVAARAQEGRWDAQGELEDVEIDIIVERQIKLPSANRNFEKIPPRPSDEAIAPSFRYDFKPFSYQAAQINPAIRPLKLKQEDQKDVNGGYISAGYGNYASPYLEGFINSKKDKNKLVGAHGLFSSSDKGPVDGRNSGSGLSMISVYGKTFTDHISLAGDAGFENRTTHFYGYAPGTEVEARDIKQSYSLFKLKGELSNAKATDFSYKLGAGFNYLADRYDATESEVDVDFSTGYKFTEASGLGVKAGYALINRKDNAKEANPRSLFFVTPSLQFFPGEKLKLSVGANLTLENDSIDSKDVHLYPDVQASYPITPSLELQASLTGGIEKVSLQTLFNENIWIAPNIEIFHTNKLYDLQAAVHTRIANKVAVKGGFSVASLKNWYFFMNDRTGDPSKFVMEYDTDPTYRANIFASVGFASAENVNILLRGDLFSYSRNDDREVWHRPTYKVTADASFNIVKKILFDINVIGQGGMKALDPILETAVELDPALDLNVRTEYLISDSFSVFVQLNNLTANEYPLFLNYPVRGFQALGGITWKF